MAEEAPSPARPKLRCRRDGGPAVQRTVMQGKRRLLPVYLCEECYQELFPIRARWIQRRTVE